MKNNNTILQLYKLPLLALFSMISSCAVDDEPVMVNIPVEETQAPEQVDTVVYKSADQMPVFRGGEKEMFDFLLENVRYPEEAREAGIEGIVVYSFVVEKDGAISNIRAVKSLSPETDQEALRVIKMTDKKWKPGLQDGESVRVEYTLPMRFTIK